MISLRALASGSNGNSIYIGDDETSVLIDAGISCKRIREGLKEMGTDPGEIRGLLITHEHSDHIQGLRVLSKLYHIPIYATKETLEYLMSHDADREIGQGLLHPIEPGKYFTIGSLKILPVRTFHDAVSPVCYRVESGSRSVAVITDTGTFTEDMVEAMQGLNGLLLEANHDIRMLETGSYPFPLKRRILSDHGHLSNEKAGELLCRLFSDQLEYCLLGHISEENNYPELALMAVKNEVDLSPVPYRSKDIRIGTATRYAPSDTYIIR